MQQRRADASRQLSQQTDRVEPYGELSSISGYPDGLGRYCVGIAEADLVDRTTDDALGNVNFIVMEAIDQREVRDEFAIGDDLHDLVGRTSGYLGHPWIP